MTTGKSIAAGLFVNGFDQRAKRLVLMDAGGRDLGGWSEHVVASRIDEALRADWPDLAPVVRFSVRAWPNRGPEDNLDLLGYSGPILGDGDISELPRVAAETIGSDPAPGFYLIELDGDFNAKLAQFETEAARVERIAAPSGSAKMEVADEGDPDGIPEEYGGAR